MAPTGHDLGVQPQRPGELTVPLVVRMTEPSRERIARSANFERVPPSLWLVVAIEADRSLRHVASIYDCEPSRLSADLDDAADLRLSAGGAGHDALARLRAYAGALRDRGDVHGVTPRLGSSIPLSPALHVAAAWALAAASDAAGLDEWVSASANRALPGRISWEAASAWHGQSLAEWMLVHAARRSRSSSTAA